MHRPVLNALLNVKKASHRPLVMMLLSSLNGWICAVFARVSSVEGSPAIFVSFLRRFSDTEPKSLQTQEELPVLPPHCRGVPIVSLAC